MGRARLITICGSFSSRMESLPVITTDQCVAGLELIRDGENGYIVPVDDNEALTQRIQDVLEGDFARMGAAALETIRPYTVENMVQAHRRIFDL